MFLLLPFFADSHTDLGNKYCVLTFAFYHGRQTDNTSRKFLPAYAVCTKHLSRMTALPIRSLTSSLLPSSSTRTKSVPLIQRSQKEAAWTLISIQLWSHSEKGAKRAIYYIKQCDIGMGLKAAANQRHIASGRWSTLARVIKSHSTCFFKRDIQIRPVISVRRQADSLQPKAYWLKNRSIPNAFLFFSIK